MYWTGPKKSYPKDLTKRFEGWISGKKDLVLLPRKKTGNVTDEPITLNYKKNTPELVAQLSTVAESSPMPAYLTQSASSTSSSSSSGSSSPTTPCYASPLSGSLAALPSASTVGAIIGIGISASAELSDRLRKHNKQVAEDQNPSRKRVYYEENEFALDESF